MVNEFGLQTTATEFETVSVSFRAIALGERD